MATDPIEIQRAELLLNDSEWAKLKSEAALKQMTLREYLTQLIRTHQERQG